MSMTVRLALKGITDLDVLIEALREMGIRTDNRRTGNVIYASFGAARMEFRKNTRGTISIRGDGDHIKKLGIENKVRQQYSLICVKRKVIQMGYSICNIENQEDGSIRLVARNWR